MAEAQNPTDRDRVGFLWRGLEVCQSGIDILCPVRWSVLKIQLVRSTLAKSKG